MAEFVHEDPLHWPQAEEHCMLLLRQRHLKVLQSAEQLHLIN